MKTQFNTPKRQRGRTLHPTVISDATKPDSVRRGTLALAYASGYLGLCLMSVSGCGPLSSGAHAEPSVRIKLVEMPKDPEPNGKGPDEAVAEIAVGPGTISGKVVFKGTIPPPQILFAKGAAPKDGEYCAKDGAIPNESLLIGSGGGVANVFIYLEKAPAGFKATVPTEPILFDQKNCAFKPHASLSIIGQDFRILNDDGVTHNYHDDPGKNPANNFSTKGNERMGSAIKFKKTEKQPFLVKCDFHGWMSAYHLPLDHPFAAVTDADGNFKIENVPGGKQVFKVWHEKCGFLESKLKVTVKAGDNKLPDLSYDAAKFGM